MSNDVSTENGISREIVFRYVQKDALPKTDKPSRPYPELLEAFLQNTSNDSYDSLRVSAVSQPAENRQHSADSRGKEAEQKNGVNTVNGNGYTSIFTQPVRLTRTTVGILILTLVAAFMIPYSISTKVNSVIRNAEAIQNYYVQEEPNDAPPAFERYETNSNTRLQYAAPHSDPLSIQEVYERVNISTVSVVVVTAEGKTVTGTGIIATQDGYIITNAHVILGGVKCNVILANDAMVEAKLVGYSAENDLAVLKIDAQGLPFVEIGDSDELRVGDTVYAIGNPLGVKLRGTLTNGIVSAINRDVDMDGMTLIQTTAALNIGNSGGPLINEYGQVIGINTLKMVSGYLHNSEPAVEGLGFAIPVSTNLWIVNDLIEYGEVRGEPMMGLMIFNEPSALETGESVLTIAEVIEGSAAAKAGVLTTDLILAADGQPLRSLNELQRIRRNHRAGETLELKVIRDGEQLVIPIQLDIAQASEETP